MTRSEQQLQTRSDAIRTAVKLLPATRLYHDGGTERINPYMPEDDAAIVRSFKAQFDRGDTLARDLRTIHARINVLGEALHDGESGLTVAELLYEFFEELPGRSAIYEWQKGRERLEWVAQQSTCHCHLEAGDSACPMHDQGDL